MSRLQELNAARAAAFAASLGFCFAAPLYADVKPASIISDHLVLQQEMKAPIWGKADPGEQVTVEIAGQTQTVQAGDDGKWIVRLDPLKAGDSPLEMTISGRNKITIHDVLVGEVWLGSGQSNMNFTVSKKVKSYAGVINEDQEIAEAHYPQIRMFTVPEKMGLEPQDDVGGEWKVCSPETVPAFSAVGYFFSRELHNARHVPVGFITAAYGATTAQAWIAKEVLAGNRQLTDYVTQLDQSVARWDAMQSSATQPASAPPSRDVSSTPTQAGARRGGRNAPRNPRRDTHSPYIFYNWMIRPIQPYGIRGALWYQGESITGGTNLYTPLMETLVSSWRKEWGEGDFPFIYVQLAAYTQTSDLPAAGGGFTGVRDLQRRMLDKIPNSAMAVTIDIGDHAEVHPHNKQELGRRLAYAARAIAYGEKIPYTGPMYESTERVAGGVRVKFKNTDGGLIVQKDEKGSDKLAGFAVAGADKQFHWADAKVDGDSVILTCPGVPEPVSVRYAWAAYPLTNLYSGAGLPASPFRTDDW